MNQEPIIQQVIRLVSSADYKPSKPRVILKTLKLSEDDFPTLRRAIKQLIRLGQVTFGANHLVFPPHKVTPPKSKRPREQSETEATEIAEPKVVRPERRPRGELSGIFRTASSADLDLCE